MKIAISILLSIFILMPQVFADDGVKDPVGITDCDANKSIDFFRRPESKKSIKRITCKDIIRWGNSIDLRSNPDLTLHLFVFETEKINAKWWFKVKLIKEDTFVWIKRPGDNNEPDLSNVGYIGEETEMSTKWDGKIYPKPEFKNPKSAEELTNAVFKEIKKVNGRLWVRVEIIASDCAPADDRPVLAAGWIPFMRSNTESNFYDQQDCTP